jgi:hypothetical protein
VLNTRHAAFAIRSIEANALHLPERRSRQPHFHALSVELAPRAYRITDPIMHYLSDR